MARIPTYPDRATLEDTDILYGVDPSSTTQDPSGDSFSTTMAAVSTKVQADLPAVPVSIPVIQSAKIDSTGTVLWSSESGWSAVVSGVGIIDVTFPTAAVGVDDQSIVATTFNGADQVSSTDAAVNLPTTTTCRVRTFYQGSLLSLNFYIHRRLPDVTVNV